MVFGLWKRRKDMTPFDVYRSVMEQARQPIFFTQWGVPDSMSGRFDMLIAHAILVFRRFKRIEGARAEEAAARSQAFSDILFKDLDRALRDTGVSDRKVPARLKMLATAYLGRGQAFGEALDAGDMEALSEAIARNAGGIVFAIDSVGEGANESANTGDERFATAENASLNSSALAHYLAQADAALTSQNDDDVLKGTFDWPTPTAQVAA